MATLTPQGKTGSWSTEAFPAQTKTWTGSGAYAGQSMIAYTSVLPYHVDYMIEKVFDSGYTYLGNAFLCAATPSQTYYMTLQFNTGVIASSYKIYDGDGTEYYSTSWTLYGSNNGSSWTTLDSRSGQGIKTNGVEYTISSPASYTYYKYDITDFYSTYNYCSINEFYLYGTTGWSHTVSGVSSPAYVCGVAKTSISKVMGV